MPRPVAIVDGERLRAEIRRLGYSQGQFARLSGLRPMTLSDAVNNKPLLPASIFMVAAALERAIIQAERTEARP
ncbi:MAG: helix-turn-helix transcriptional regulator [Candidatus Dormiibacterota bacterium]